MVSIFQIYRPDLCLLLNTEHLPLPRICIVIRVRHRGAVPPGLKKSNLAEFSQGETEKSDLNPEFRGAGVAASYGHETFVLCSKIP